MAFNRRRTYGLRRRYRRKTATTRKPIISRSKYLAINKRINRISKQVQAANVYVRAFRELGSTNLNSSNPIRQLAITSCTDYNKLFAPNHNTPMRNLAYSAQKFYLHAMAMDVHVESSGNPDPCSFKVALVTKSRQGNKRTAPPSWTVNEDYWVDSCNQILINSKFWKVHWSKQFELSHFEHLSTNPTTNSNNPVGNTHKRISIYKKFRKPMCFRKGDRDDVWECTIADLPYYQGYHLVIISTNPSPTLSNVVNMTSKLYVSCPS